METEPAAADRRGKKRQREVRESEEVEALLPSFVAAPESASPGLGGHNLETKAQPTAAKKGEQEGVDRISSLPDDILRSIVSLLPTKDGARTQILSPEWRPIWRSAPLNHSLFDVPNNYNYEDVIGNISWIIFTHQGPGKLFVVPWYYNHYHPNILAAWLESPALNNLEEIHFCHSFNVARQLPPPALPESMIRFSACLHAATLSECSLPDNIADVLRFPNLKKLALIHVGISEGSLGRLIAECPALECFQLADCYGFHCVRINSVSLIAIGVHADNPFSGLEEIVIQDAPNLKRFLFLQCNMNLQISVISAPKLEALGCDFHHNDSTRLTLGSTVIQGSGVISSATVVSTIKILAVNMHRLCLDTIIDLMRCFPFLEKLYVQPYNAGGPNNSWRRKHRDLLRSLEIHLKKVVMFEYRGTRSQQTFATFFVLNAKKLEIMRFEGGSELENDKFVAKQRRKLHLNEKAPVGAEFRFITDKQCRHDIFQLRDAHALSRTDPFECCYCN